MKRFLYGAIGLLCVAAAFHLGAETAGTCYVDHTCRGIMAHCLCRTGGIRALDEDGLLWEVSASGVWEPDGSIPALPVPVCEIKFIATSGQECSFVTDSNEVWFCDGHGDWVSCGVWPGDSAVERRSWGGIKAGFR
ncbi:MAG: hypothetical protein JXB46_00445 [Candidatus Eisenbacteria bacterium]|nr:hypothetical protein [Candidatus Eisenbacteria bacterium]